MDVPMVSTGAARAPATAESRVPDDGMDEQLRYALRVEQDVEALRSMPTGGYVTTLLGTYAMQAETIRGERRWHWLLLDGRTVSASPASGRPDAVRRFAVRHYRDRLERERLYGREGRA